MTLTKHQFLHLGGKLSKMSCSKVCGNLLLKLSQSESVWKTLALERHKPKAYQWDLVGGGGVAALLHILKAGTLETSPACFLNA